MKTQTQLNNQFEENISVFDVPFVVEFISLLKVIFLPEIVLFFKQLYMV